MFDPQTPESPTLVLPIPASVHRALDTLRAAGHAAFLVGNTVRSALLGQTVREFDITTSAHSSELLALWPRAVATGIAHGTVMLPTEDGPIDITSFRAGPSLEADLAKRDFTINAIAYDPQTETLFDPFGGLADLREKRLRTVGDAHDRFREDPLRMLRALRFQAELQFELPAALEAAIALDHAQITGVATERIKHELLTLLMAPDAAQALAALARTGLQKQIVPRLAPDAADLIAHLPAHLELRLAACFHHANVASSLNRLRVSQRIVKHVAHLVAHHPIGHYGSNAGKKTNPKHDVEVRRLLKRTGIEDAFLLLQLREAEIALLETTHPAEAAQAQSALAQLRDAIARVQAKGALALRRADLELQGSDVMEILNCSSGPEIGHALAFLLEHVLKNPACNTHKRLRELLVDWQQTQLARRAKKNGTA